MLAVRVLGVLSWIWAFLARRRVLQALALLVALWGLVVWVVPGLRPGLSSGVAGAQGQMAFLWDLFHPVAAWALRGLLTMVVLVAVVRVVHGFVPATAGLVARGEPVNLATAGSNSSSDGERVWVRVLAVLGSGQSAATAPAPVGGAGQLLAYSSWGRRLLSQGAFVGLILASVGCLLLAFGAQHVVTSPLLARVPSALPGLPGTEVELVQVRPPDGQRPLRRLTSVVLWYEQGEARPEAMVVAGGRWKPHDGYWVRLGDVRPALVLRATADAGAPLTLQPVVGDRQGISAYRGVVEDGGEHVLTVPEAGMVLRIVGVAGESGGTEVSIEVLDGGLGTVIRRLYPASQSRWVIGGVTIEADVEQACVLSLWRLPGVTLLLVGLLAMLASVVLRRVYPVQRAWIGVVHKDGGAGSWQILVAAEPAAFADALAQRLGITQE